MASLPKELRYKILLRDDFKCRNCGYGGRYSDVILEVHHLVWRSWGGDDRESNLITLCRYCHDYIHNKIPMRPSTFKEERKKRGRK